MHATCLAALAACAALAAAGAAPWALGATAHGSVDTDPNTVILRGAAEQVQITGTVSNSGARDVVITVTRPDGTEDVRRARASLGEFGITYTVQPDFETGRYYVSGESGNRRLGQITFSVVNLGAPAPPPARQPAPAPAQPPPPPIPLTVATDSASYGAGDAVTVYGSAPAWKEVLVSVAGPGGAVVAEGRPSTDGAGRYSAAVPLAAAPGGTYTVTALHGGDSARTSFTVAAQPAAAPAAAPPPAQPATQQPQQQPPQRSSWPTSPFASGVQQQRDEGYYLTLFVATIAVTMTALIVMQRGGRRLLSAWAARGARGARQPGAARAPAFPGGAPAVSFYECPRCYSPDIDNRPGGGAFCRSCGFSR